ncbi:hypothetical protein [Paenibacillus rigui]|uniref:hypothetical protein n=1 Tax=Paenibacillus rigui TaxID=554312 RepID=UPI0015C65AAA|nr:hypothetical protein [Paenibacillus rigui]
MEPFVIAVLAVIVVSVLMRIRMTYRRARKEDRTEEIQSRLAALRKKRDEE